MGVFSLTGKVGARVQVQQNFQYEILVVLVESRVLSGTILIKISVLRISSNSIY